MVSFWGEGDSEMVVLLSNWKEMDLVHVFAKFGCTGSHDPMQNNSG